MEGLKLPVNERKTRCLRCPEDMFDFLGYRVGRIHRPTGKGSYTGIRPTKASVQSICRKVSELTTPRYGPLSPDHGGTLNRTSRWANYFSPGMSARPHSAVNQHASGLRMALSKAQVRSGSYVARRTRAGRVRLVHLTGRQSSEREGISLRKPGCVEISLSV